MAERIDRQKEQDTRICRKTLGMISALLIASLLDGCGDSKQRRMMDSRVKQYPADVASVSGISQHEPWGQLIDGPGAVFGFKKALASTFQLKLEIAWAFGEK